ncbi:MAG TPA: DNA repair protein RecN [Motilibacteraceae bacterium]|nr:DNA repair protein RecN [Motilibacteraceae bacterium]
MLEHLRIRGLGVIEDAELELSPGLTVITGETGAGKTMVVTGLGLLLGGKADAGRVRPGERSAVVEGRVVLAEGHPALVRAQEAGAELEPVPPAAAVPAASAPPTRAAGRRRSKAPEDPPLVSRQELLVVRSVSAEGRSRAHLGGSGVPLAVLGELADDLVAVHGQDDQRRLLQPARQRAALDRFAGAAVAEPLAAYAEDYARLREVRRTLEELTTRARERAQEADLLRFGLDEVEAVSPVAGEDTELAAEEGRLAHADGLRAAAASAHEALLGDPSADGVGTVDAVALVGAARRALDTARDHDPALAALADRLAEVSYLLSDVGADLASYTAGMDTDPARLAAVQERRAALSALQRKYGDTAAAVLEWARGAAVRLAELEGDDERIGALRAEEERLLDRLADLAGQVSRARQQAAGRLGEQVTAELADLAMPHARVSVQVRQSEDPEGLAVDGRRVAFGATGVDEVELLLAPHPGAPARALHKGASGGELSRVMLAVEVVFAGADPVPTFVFDEVDAGVGGKAAVEVGRRLARLARSAQVLVVTHLPQVAAFADRHLQVVKSSDGSVTRTGVVALDDDARVQELSRMLAGLEGSETALAHAEELLEAARSAKAG